MEKKKILIVEDDIDMIEAIEIVLKSMNYTTIRALDPDEGWVMMKKEKPDMVILDAMFGHSQKTKGFDLALKMRQNKELSHIPVLMLTAVNLQYPQFGFSAGTDGEYLPVDEFVDKPVQPEDLLKKIEKLLEQKISKWINWPEKSRDADKQETKD